RAGNRHWRRGRHGHVDRPRRRHDEERRRRDLSRCGVLSDFVCQMVSAEQRGSDLRVRGGRPGEQSLPVLGMEVGKTRLRLVGSRSPESKTFNYTENELILKEKLGEKSHLNPN